MSANRHTGHLSTNIHVYWYSERDIVTQKRNQILTSV